VTFKKMQDIDGVVKHVLGGMRRRQKSNAPQLGEGLLGALVLAWRQAMREGDKRMATQLLSLAASQKKFNKCYRALFDDIISPEVVAPLARTHTHTLLFYSLAHSLTQPHAHTHT
jgi:hypothetical protein